MRMHARSRRRARRVIASLSALVMVVLIVAMCIPVYAPRDDEYNVQEIDAVFILGPPTKDRIALGESIARQAGGVPVYLSVWPGVGCEPRFVCVHADPWTTVGEAAALDEAVHEDGVRHPLVITSSAHMMRARYVFDRCVPVHTTMIGVHRALTLGDVVSQPIYQWGAMLKFVIGGCAKRTTDSLIRYR